MSYVYSTELIARTKSKVVDTLFVQYDKYPQQRVTRNQHGIKVTDRSYCRRGSWAPCQR